MEKQKETLNPLVSPEDMEKLSETIRKRIEARLYGADESETECVPEAGTGELKSFVPVQEEEPKTPKHSGLTLFLFKTVRSLRTLGLTQEAYALPDSLTGEDSSVSDNISGNWKRIPELVLPAYSPCFILTDSVEDLKKINKLSKMLSLYDHPVSVYVDPDRLPQLIKELEQSTTEDGYSEGNLFIPY